jgi:hypothetical protein
MITMMALAGMKPGELHFDPRLYQYGGLFIYPVGALIKLCDVLGLIEVRSDLVYYLDHPDEFGKFYIVARLYSAAWGLLGVFVVFAIARRLGCDPSQSPVATRLDIAPLLAAAFFGLMPVVVCMSHEAKPHLPGAVLMLAAVYFGIRAVQATKHSLSTSSGIASSTAPDERSAKYFWLMCLGCGAALGMVLSSAPVLILIPLVAWLSRPSRSAPLPKHGFVRSAVAGVAISLFVYCLTNPYIVINLFINREVLRSNFGNSLAMYEIARVGEGLARVLELTVEGATLPLLVFGGVAFVGALVRRSKPAAVLAVPALVFFLQFVLIGAGKPAEYGRFGIFTNSALAIGAAYLFADAWRRRATVLRALAIGLVVAWVAICGAAYLRNFRLDASHRGSRMVLAKTLAGESTPAIILTAEPAPYSCPPLNFASLDVLLAASRQQPQCEPGRCCLLIQAVDELGADARPTPDLGPGWLMLLRRETPISWANKPFVFERCNAAGEE